MIVSELSIFGKIRRAARERIERSTRVSQRLARGYMPALGLSARRP